MLGVNTGIVWHSSLLIARCSHKLHSAGGRITDDIETQHVSIVSTACHVHPLYVVTIYILKLVKMSIGCNIGIFQHKWPVVCQHYYIYSIQWQ